MFKTLIEDLTSIKFTYVVIDNLAEVLSTKDSIGYDKLPRFVREEEKEDFMQDLEFLLENRKTAKKHKNTIAIEVPQTPRKQKIQAKKIQQPTLYSEKHTHTKPITPLVNEGSISRQVIPVYSQVITTSKTTQKLKRKI